MVISGNEKYRYIVFILVFFVAISPILFNKFFPTVDGPAHLYNSRILREMLIGDSGFYSRFFELNHVPVPNWTGHLLAAVTGMFLPLWLTEKIIILLIVTLLPVSMLFLAKAYGAKHDWQILLVIPFIYTITLYLGFFNFMLALPLMLFFMTCFKMEMFHKSRYGFIMMLIFSTVIYFSHLMIFVLTFFFMLLEMIRSAMVIRKINMSDLIKIASFIPGILLSILFFEGRGVEGFKNSVDVLPVSTLWQWIKEGSPLVGLNGEIEGPSTSVFVIGLTIIFLFILLMRIKNRIIVNSADMLLLFALVMLICYFIIPDGIASGGFISLRILLLFFIFITIWILTHPLPKVINIAAALLGIYVSFSTLIYRHTVADQLSDEAENLIIVTDKISDGSVLLPLNYSQNWLHINLSNYIGANKNIIVLDNYEAVLNEFPLKWKKDKMPGLLAGNFAQSLNPSITIENYEAKTGVKINYVTRLHFDNSENDSLKSVTNNQLNNLYRKSLKVGNCDLFYN